MRLICLKNQESKILKSKKLESNAYSMLYSLLDLFDQDLRKERQSLLSMGDSTTTTRRLNLAPSFNPMGSNIGILVAKDVILAKLNKLSTAERVALGQKEFEIIKMADLKIVRTP